MIKRGSETRRSRVPPAFPPELDAQARQLLRQLLDRLPRFKRREEVGDLEFEARDGKMRMVARAAPEAEASPVYFVELFGPGGESHEFVVKWDSRRKQNLARFAEMRGNLTGVLAGIFPQLYGQERSWLVLEKVEGLEDEEIAPHVSKNAARAKSYGQHVADVLASAGETGHRIWDVTFWLGHNVRLDPSRMTIRLMELDCLQPAQVPAGEEIARVLFTELDMVSQTLPPERAAAILYAMHLTQGILGRFREQDIVRRPSYERQSGRASRWKQQFLSDAVPDGPLTLLASLRSSCTEVLDPAMCAAARSGNLAAFSRFFVREHIVDIFENIRFNRHPIGGVSDRPIALRDDPSAEVRLVEGKTSRLIPRPRPVPK